MRKTRFGARPLLKMTELGSQWTWMTMIKHERGGSRSEVLPWRIGESDGQAGWRSTSGRKWVSTRVQTHMAGGELRRAVGMLRETGAGRPSLDRQRETHDEGRKGLTRGHIWYILAFPSNAHPTEVANTARRIDEMLPCVCILPVVSRDQK